MRLTRPTQSTDLQNCQASRSASAIANFIGEPRPLLKAYSLSFVVLFLPISCIVYYFFVIYFVGLESHYEAIVHLRVRYFLGMTVLVVNTSFSTIIATIYGIRMEQEKHPLTYALSERFRRFFKNFFLNILASSNLFFSEFLINLIQVRGIIAAFEELLVLGNLLEVLMPILRDSLALVILGTILYHTLTESEINNDGEYRIVEKPETYFFFRTLLILEIAGLGSVFYKSHKSADTSDLKVIFARNFLDGSQSFSTLCRTLTFSFPVTVTLWIALCVWNAIVSFKEGVRRDNEERELKHRQEKKREKQRIANNLGFYQFVRHRVLGGPGIKQSYSFAVS